MPNQPPESPETSQDRVRLREGWDIWVPVIPPQPPSLPLLLSCKTLNRDTRYLLDSSTQCPYELDIMFIPGYGLWPTWTCCPPAGQVHFNTISVSFRIFETYDINQSKIPIFINRFKACASFKTVGGFRDRNPPPATWNFYRLLVSLLALGPQGLSSPSLQSRHRGSLSICQYTIKHLILSVTSKPETNEDVWRRMDIPLRVRPAESNNPRVPYGVAGGEDYIFPGPEQGSRYFWNGPLRPYSLHGVDICSGDHLGLYLANTLWALLDFKWLSRRFGLIAYEGILDTVEYWVDGEPRPTFDMDDLLSRLPISDGTPEEMEDLELWREWVVQWRKFRREGLIIDSPRPQLRFPRHLPTWRANLLYPPTMVD